MGEALQKVESAPDDASPADGRRLTVIGVVISVALHVVVMVTLRLVLPEAERERAISVIDIQTAPRAPEAEALPPEQEAPPESAAAAGADEQGEVEMPDEAPPEEGVGMVDAGVPVDAPEPVDAPPKKRRVDAGVDGGGLDDAQLARGAVDGGVVVDDGGLAMLEVPADGGVVAAVAADGRAPADDGGAMVASAAGDGGVPGGVPGGVGTSDGGVGPFGPPGGADPTGSVAAKPSSGTAANLLNYFPRGHVVTVMARLDRLRGTEWAERVETLLKPLPDYRGLVGDADVGLADNFDLLVVSSARPDDAVATTVLVRTRMAPAELRDFIDQPDAPVAWSAVKGGALGKRGRSPRVFHGDQRVFLSWAPGWMVLTQPRDLGPLTTPRTGDLDRAARPIDLPPWLARAATISDESGEPTGPALMVTAANMFGDEIPMVGVAGASIPAPEQATITLEIVVDGFLLRGNLRYPDDSAAATAQDAIERLRLDLMNDRASRFVLERVGAVNPLRNLTLKRTGRRVAFSTSASIAEARAILAVVAQFVTAHFEERRAVPVRRPAPATP